MFEQSLITSTTDKGGRGLSRKGAIVTASLGVQAGLVVALAVGPLLWPATLPQSAMRPKMTSVSLLKKPVMKVEVKPQQVVASATAPSLPGRTVQVETSRGSRVQAISTNATPVDGALLPVGNAMGEKPGGMGLFAGAPIGSGPAVSVAPSGPAKKEGPVQVSKGVMAGRLLAPIQPVYPRIAVAARQEGIVVITAVIDKDGRIIGAKATSGPPMLVGAAVDAVKEARYQPYLLNGEPTEVVTTVTVNFRLGT
jgi:protein TonB